MQLKTDTKMTFAERVNALAISLGDMSRVASRMGISRQTLYKALNGEPSLKTLKKLTDVELSLESGKSDGDMVMEEGQQAYGARGRSRFLAAQRQAIQPTRAQIEARFAAYLDAAERVPGGLGHAWALACIHFNPTALEALKTEP